MRISFKNYIYKQSLRCFHFGNSYFIHIFDLENEPGHLYVFFINGHFISIFSRLSDLVDFIKVYYRLFLTDFTKYVHHKKSLELYI